MRGLVPLDRLEITMNIGHAYDYAAFGSGCRWECLASGANQLTGKDDRSGTISACSVLPSRLQGRWITNAAPPPLFPLHEPTRMLPPCRSMISRVTHSPSPVPTSFLVVKNGSKI